MPSRVELVRRQEHPVEPRSPVDLIGKGGPVLALYAPSRVISDLLAYYAVDESVDTFRHVCVSLNCDEHGLGRGPSFLEYVMLRLDIELLERQGLGLL